MLARNRRYDIDPTRCIDLQRPTLSVGNITAGGTGKTPVVQYIARKLLELGHHPAILMRGYRATSAGLSDEQQLLASTLRIPVQADPDRVAGAAAVLERRPDTTCFILDDGFQHRRAGRNFDLVLLNAVEPFGFGHVHPRGLLREPLIGLKRASAVLITHASEAPEGSLMNLQQQLHDFTSAPVFHADHVNSHVLSADGTARFPIQTLGSTPFVFFTGIGHPQSLLAFLKQFPTLRHHRLYPDHHPYSSHDLESLQRLCREHQAQALVTTEKDFVKLAELLSDMQTADSPAVLRLDLSIQLWPDEESPFIGHLLQCLSAKQKK